MFEITNDMVKGPYFGIIKGPPGVGKSWLARFSEKPFYIAVEKGVEKVPGVGRFIENGQIKLPEDKKMFFDMMMHFVKNDHEYKTIVIDSGKFIDKLFEQDLIKNEPTEMIKKVETKVNSIADYTFGRGYAKMIGPAYWGRFLAGVDALHKKGINVILIAHTREKNVSNRDGEEYQKHKMDMMEFGISSVPALLEARADWSFFMNSETSTKATVNNFGAKKVVAGSGMPETVVYTRNTNFADAKVRTGDVNNVKDFYVIDIEDDSTSKIIFEDLLK